VLATLKTEDFFYTCAGHLTDPGFASKAGDTGDGGGGAVGSRKLGLSEEEIAKVKEEWEAKQKRKAEKEKEKEKEKGEEGKKDGEDKKDGENSEKKKTDDKAASKAAPAMAAGSRENLKAVHERYTLHREIWQSMCAAVEEKTKNTDSTLQCGWTTIDDSGRMRKRRR
jgi:hypothetical protein